MAYEDQYQSAAPTATNTGTAGMANYSGWAGQQGFTPSMLKQTYDNPWFFVPYVYQGIDPNSRGYQAMRDMGGDPLTLYNIEEGGQGSMKARNEGDFANYMAKQFQQMGTSGAQMSSAKDLLGTLFGQQKFGENSDTTLGQLLGAGDASSQSRIVYNLARDISNMRMNPVAAKGFQANLGGMLDQFGQQSLSQDASKVLNPSAWIAKNAPWLMEGLK